MISDSVIDTDLIHAFRETHYHVHGTQPFTLLIDERSTQLVAMHLRFDVDCSTFVTACNPLSKLADDATNAARHAELRSELVQRELAHIEGIGKHPSNLWPGEPSFLVFGMELKAAEALGQSLMQNAIIWSGADAIPRLILLR